MLEAAPGAATMMAIGLLLAGTIAPAQEPFFAVRRAGAPLRALLDAGHPAWGAAASITWGPPRYATEFRALYGDRGLALRFAATDDAPWHTMTGRDQPIWNEEVVEIFIDPDGDGRNYAEIEISPANVVCDLQIFSAEPSVVSDLDWDFAGLLTRVSPGRATGGAVAGWTATAILPWDGFAALDNTTVALPPEPAARWKFNVFRIKRPGGPEAPQRGVIYAPWSPTPTLSFHAPAAFRDLLFEGGRSVSE